MEQHGITELELEEDNFHIKLKKGGAAREAAGTPVIPMALNAADVPPAAPVPAAPSPVPAPAMPPASAVASHEIRSPCVGTFFRAPAPDAELFVETGDPVDPDTSVCIVEAMKVMNEIKAECHGTVEKILVENGQPVEYDQVLFLIAP